MLRAKRNRQRTSLWWSLIILTGVFLLSADLSRVWAQESHIYVDQKNGINSQDTAGSEENPFKSIKYALLVSAYNNVPDPWVVHIKEGVYDNNPDKDANARETFPIELRDNITLIGDDGAEKCIISGAYIVDSQSPLVRGTDVNNITIQGLTFQDNIRTGSSTKGGGMELTSATGTISNCVLKNNYASNGGGIKLSLPEFDGVFSIENNTFFNNENNGLYIDSDFRGNISKNIFSYTGTGLSITGSGDSFVGNITNNTFYGNFRGIYMGHQFQGDIDSNVFHSNNSSNANGGGIYFSNAVTGNIINNVFVRNSTNAHGAAFYSYSSFTGNIQNNIFSGNTADNGGAFAINRSYKGIISNNVFSYNTSGTYDGGSIAFFANGGLVSDIIISNNYFLFQTFSSTNDNLGVSCIYSDLNATIMNNTFVEESKDQTAIAISSYASDSIIQNNIFYNAKHAIWLETELDPVIADNDFYNSDNVLYRNNIPMGNDLFYIMMQLSNFTNNHNWDPGFFGEGIAQGGFSQDAYYDDENDVTIFTDNLQNWDQPFKGVFLKTSGVHFPIFSNTATKIKVKGNLAVADIGKRGDTYQIDDFHLAQASQNIDAGASLSGVTITNDFEGDVRPQGSAPDIGADEFTRAPTVSSVEPNTTNVGLYTATIQGGVYPNGSETTYYFEYGITDAYGGQTPERSAGSGTENVFVSETIENLNPDTVYHFRLIAENEYGTATGPDQVFFTQINTHKAIIIAGGGPYAGNHIWDSTVLCANYAYKALMYQGYPKDRIQYLSPVTEIDADSNGEMDDVDAVLTHMSLETAITNWANDTVTEHLLLYMVDHGGNGTFKLNENETLTATDLDQRLDTLQANLPGRVIVIYEACQSGSFLPLLTPPAGKERLLLTSASSDEPALIMNGGRFSFSFQFWAEIFNGAPVDTSFFFASDMMNKYQTAQLEANGNGVGNEKDDRSKSDGILIGWGKENFSDTPVIESVTVEPAIIKEGSSAIITAVNVMDANGIERVWAVIVPPGYDPGASDIPVTKLPTIELTETDTEGIYHATYDNFTEFGNYDIGVYAEDTLYTYSLPKTATVEQTQDGIVLKGDINGDGGLDMTDLISGLRILCGYESDIRTDYADSNTDVDGGNRVGFEEIDYIMQKLIDVR